MSSGPSGEQVLDIRVHCGLVLGGEAVQACIQAVRQGAHGVCQQGGPGNVIDEQAGERSRPAGAG